MKQADTPTLPQVSVNSGVVSLQLTAEQADAVRELLSRAYRGAGGCAIFAEVRRECVLDGGGATLLLGLVSRKCALSIRKALEKEAEFLTSPDNQKREVIAQMPAAVDLSAPPVGVPPVIRIAYEGGEPLTLESECV